MLPSLVVEISGSIDKSNAGTEPETDVGVVLEFED
jgi:hypothetical protein